MAHNTNSNTLKKNEKKKMFRLLRKIKIFVHLDFKWQVFIVERSSSFVTEISAASDLDSAAAGLMERLTCLVACQCTGWSCTEQLLCSEQPSAGPLAHVEVSVR